MLLAITFELEYFTEKNEAIWISTYLQINKSENLDKRTFVSASHLARWLSRLQDTVCLFVGSALQFGFLPSNIKPCFSLKSVLLNSSQTEANQQCIGWPIDQIKDWFQIRLTRAERIKTEKM